jgi:SAM-dependent methyltransferase
VLDAAQPASIIACDPSHDFVAHARHSVIHPAVTFVTAAADDLPRREHGFEAIVSGLVLNFLAAPEVAATSMAERLGPGGTLAAYVWDYGEGMQFLSLFWRAVVELDPAAAALDEAKRFPLCRPEALVALLQIAGLDSVQVRALEIETAFPSFHAYWEPFLGGTGPAPAYVASLQPERREALRRAMQARLAPTGAEPIRLTARAWAVQGRRPGGAA